MAVAGEQRGGYNINAGVDRRWASHLGADLVSVYVPTTPNPTSGFFLMLPRADVIELDMSVDEALTYVISMGSVVPPPYVPKVAPSH